MDPLELLPDTLHGGETLYVASIVVTDFVPATHTLSYMFAHSTPLTVAAAALEDGTGWSLTVPATETVKWPTGPISFTAMVTAESDDRVTAVDSGAIRVTASPLFVSWAKTALDAVEAQIQGRASSDQQSMSLGDMSVGFMSMKALLESRQWLRNEVRKDSSNRPRRIILARFT